MSEESIQIAVCRYMSHQYPDVIYTSEGSGIRLTIGQAVKAKKLRSEGGLPDLMIFEPRGQYYGLFLELKKVSPYKKNGELKSDKHLHEQNEILNRLSGKGYYAEFATGIDEAIKIIDLYLFLKPINFMKASEVAAQYIGQTEIKGNMGFKDPCFEEKMRAVGFQDSHPWCAYFAEVVFKEAYPEKFAELDKLFSASAVQTYKNFVDAKYQIEQTPQKDSLVIWQTMKDGKYHWTGHAAIVSKVIDDETFEAIEGNTNMAGSREGVLVNTRTRKVIKDIQNGLKVIGFIKI